MANIADNVLGMADIPYSFWWKTLDAGVQPMYVADQSQSTPTPGGCSKNGTLANRVDPEQTPQHVASYQGLHGFH